MTDLEAKAREFLSTFEPDEYGLQDLAVLLRSVAAEARKEALEEAAKALEAWGSENEGYDDDGCLTEGAPSVVRALAGRKEGT